MMVDSFRFGPLEVPGDKIITMKRPILGFEQLCRFCLVHRPELEPFWWLQSVDDRNIAFLVVNPRVFFSDYRIEVNPREIAELEINNLDAVETYVIVTIPDDPERISVNLQGPVLVNTENGFAKQLVLVNSDYRVQHCLLDLAAAQGGVVETVVEEVAG